MMETWNKNYIVNVLVGFFNGKKKIVFEYRVKNNVLMYYRKCKIKNINKYDKFKNFIWFRLL